MLVIVHNRYYGNQYTTLWIDRHMTKGTYEQSELARWTIPY